jgi:hypothetical protein
MRTDEARRHAHMMDDLATTETIRECYQHAEACEREAIAQTDPHLRKDFLDTAARWVKLAQSHEFRRATRQPMLGTAENL